MTTVEKYFRDFQKISENYEKDHPRWRIEVLVSLIKLGLASLKHYVENVRDSEITWAEPFVEFHHPAGWNWEARGDADIAPGGQIFGRITKKNTANRTKAVKTLSKIMACRFTAMALADATNWAWYEKLNDYYTPVLPLELSEKLSAIKNEHARREAFNELVRPFSIGVASIDYGDMEFKDGTRVPKQVTKQLANIGKSMDIPRIGISAEVNGRKLEMSLLFQIYPLIADYDKKKAYHPITVGLFIQPEISGRDVVTRTPADWPRRDRETLWDGLLQEVDTLTDRFIPKTERQNSIILSVNSEIKIPAEWWRPENRSAEIKRIADALAQGGDLVKFNVEAAESSSNGTCPVCSWIHDRGFTQIRIDDRQAISLGGILPDIVRLVHREHEKGLARLSTKADTLLKTCGGYKHPCKAFDDLGQRLAYKALFDTSRRGFIALHGFRRKESEQIGS